MPTRRNRNSPKLSRRQLKDRRRRLIQRHKPWTTSSGPITLLGKKTVSQNAIKHGLCSRWFSKEECRAYATIAQQFRRKNLL